MRLKLKLFIILITLSVSTIAKSEGIAEGSAASLTDNYITVQYPVTHHNNKSFAENIDKSEIDNATESNTVFTDILSIKLLPSFLLIVVYYVLIRRKTGSRAARF